LNLVRLVLISDRYGVKLLHRDLDLRTHFTAHLGHCSMRDEFSLLHRSYSRFLKKTLSPLRQTLPGHLHVCRHKFCLQDRFLIIVGDELYL
jgi:hypothetical protein